MSAPRLDSSGKKRATQRYTTSRRQPIDFLWAGLSRTSLGSEECTPPPTKASASSPLAEFVHSFAQTLPSSGVLRVVTGPRRGNLPLQNARIHGVATDRRVLGVLEEAAATLV